MGARSISTNSSLGCPSSPSIQASRRSSNVDLLLRAILSNSFIVAFDVYDLDRDGFISNGELFVVLKIMSGDHLKPSELQQVVDKTIRDADKDGDGKISFDEFQVLVQSGNSDFLSMWNFDV